MAERSAAHTNDKYLYTIRRKCRMNLFLSWCCLAQQIREILAYHSAVHVGTVISISLSSSFDTDDGNENQEYLVGILASVARVC